MSSCHENHIKDLLKSDSKHAGCIVLAGKNNYNKNGTYTTVCEYHKLAKSPAHICRAESKLWKSKASVTTSESLEY